MESDSESEVGSPLDEQKYPSVSDSDSEDVPSPDDLAQAITSPAIHGLAATNPSANSVPTTDSASAPLPHVTPTADSVAPPAPAPNPETPAQIPEHKRQHFSDAELESLKKPEIIRLIPTRFGAPDHEGNYPYESLRTLTLKGETTFYRYKVNQDGRLKFETEGVVLKRMKKVLKEQDDARKLARTKAREAKGKSILDGVMASAEAANKRKAVEAVEAAADAGKGGEAGGANNAVLSRRSYPKN